MARARCRAFPSSAFPLVIVAALSATTRVTYADEPTIPLTPNQPSPKMDAADAPTPLEREASSLPADRDEGATTQAWRAKYAEARARLLDGDFADAAVMFAALEASAENASDRALAHEQRTLADAWTARNVSLVRRSDLAAVKPAPLLDKRSTDEVVTLYLNSILYGIGTGIWVGTLTEPRTPATGILPAIALTAGSIGTVIALDSGSGFRYGVPQSITTGLWIGLEEGILWAAWHDSRSGVKDLRTKEASTLIWSTSTAGAVLGGVLGEFIPTTPGRSSWTGSVATWSSAVTGFAAGGLTGKAPESLAVAGLSLTIGTGIGMATAGSVSPTVGRVRLIDLAAALSGATAAGVYVAAANNRGNGRAASGVTSIGIVAGLVIGWLATSSMPDDPLRRSPSATVNDGHADASPQSEPQRKDIHGHALHEPSRSKVIRKRRTSVLEGVRPMLIPLAGNELPNTTAGGFGNEARVPNTLDSGAMMSLVGSLD